MKMKVIALLGLLCTFPAAAIAQTTQCQSIRKDSERLACYDKAAPPAAVSKTPRASDQPAAPKTSTGEQGGPVDMLAVENSKLDAKLKNICRGC